MSLHHMMKFLVVTLLALASATNARTLRHDDFLEDNTAFGYHRKFGISLAKEIRMSEKAVVWNPSVTIARGSVARQGQFPYQAGLINKLPGSVSVCGGSLISTSRVMTAAHCWYDGEQQATGVEVVLGSVRLFSGGTRKYTRNVVMHPNWNPHLIHNDIAIVYLPSVSLSGNIAVIALPSGNELNENFVGKTAVASGFGITSDRSIIRDSQVLSHVNLQVISNAECNRFFGIIQPSNICTSGASGRSTCSGDSGGPLVFNSNNKPIVIGITSFGSDSGCQIGAPAAFTRVSSFMNFIQRNL